MLIDNLEDVFVKNRGFLENLLGDCNEKKEALVILEKFLLEDTKDLQPLTKDFLIFNKKIRYELSEPTVLEQVVEVFFAAKILIRLLDEVLKLREQNINEFKEDDIRISKFNQIWDEFDLLENEGCVLHNPVIFSLNSEIEDLGRNDVPVPGTDNYFNDFLLIKKLAPSELFEKTIDLSIKVKKKSFNEDFLGQLVSLSSEASSIEKYFCNNVYTKSAKFAAKNNIAFVFCFSDKSQLCCFNCETFERISQGSPILEQVKTTVDLLADNFIIKHSLTCSSPENNSDYFYVCPTGAGLVNLSEKKKYVEKNLFAYLLKNKVSSEK